MTGPVISANDLALDYPARGGYTRAVDGVSFSFMPGSVHGIVGESGSGKSSIAMALMGLTGASHARITGTLAFEGRDMKSFDERHWRRLRGDRITMVFQDAMATLNPLLRVGVQLGEVFRYHRPAMSQSEIRRASLELLERVGIAEPERRLESYPHQLSGGMRQRVVIAAAIALKPTLLIADEPTTALDVTVQAQILDLMLDLIRENGTTLVLISHDLDVVGDVCEQVMVMKDGKVVEAGSVEAVLVNPKHEYTQQLLASRPQFAHHPVSVQ